jgi:Domain of unknown function (DUF4389)
MSDPGWGNSGQGGGFPPPGGNPAPGGFAPPAAGPPPGSYPPPAGPPPGYPPPPPGGFPPQGGYPPPGGGFAPPAGSATALASNPNYPVTAGFDGPLQVARWRVIGNPIMAIPHLIFVYVLQIVAFFALIVAWFAALFTGQVPQGIGDFLAGVQRYTWRVTTFQFFLREDYPAFEVPSGYAEPGGDRAWLNIAPPQQLSRVSVFFRGLLIIPLYIVAIAWAVAFYVAWIVGFFGVLFTGSWPVGMRSLLLRVNFWMLRVNCWYFLLADPYPPFGLD